MVGVASAAEGDTVTVRPLMTAGDVARVLQVGERTVWRLASRSRAGGSDFPRPVRIGEQVVRWRWEDVQKYLQQKAGK